MASRITPAQHVINSFGGVRATARALGRYAGAITQWKRTGRVPSVVQEAILLIAEKKGLDITAEDLIRGRERTHAD